MIMLQDLCGRRVNNFLFLKVSNRAGISCAAGVRRPPNCFNMIRQIEVLDRAGVTEEADKVPDARSLFCQPVLYCTFIRFVSQFPNHWTAQLNQQPLLV